MKKLIFLAALMPLLVNAQEAPWGISKMQFGPQVSWSKYSEDWTTAGYPQYHRQTNTSVGLNGRIQFSLLDLLLYNGHNGHTPRFRIVDVIGTEAGVGYQNESTSVSDPAYLYDKHTSTLWYNFGIDAGLMAAVRILPQVDLGVKFQYLSYVNSTFNNTNFVPLENSSGRTKSAYGNGTNWGFVGRAGRIYGEVNFIRGGKYPTYITVIDLKYRYAEHKAWAPYVGIQVGMGSTPINSYYNYSTTAGSLTRNWVQLSIGKMTNF